MLFRKGQQKNPFSLVYSCMANVSNLPWISMGTPHPSSHSSVAFVAFNTLQNSRATLLVFWKSIFGVQIMSYCEVHASAGSQLCGPLHFIQWPLRTLGKFINDKICFPATASWKVTKHPPCSLGHLSLSLTLKSLKSSFTATRSAGIE